MGGLWTTVPARTTRLSSGSWRASLVTFLETIWLALDSLRAHKLRSFLTLLGVILAVMVLVVVMSFVTGMNFYVADKIANLGANVFIVDRFGIITSRDAFIKAQKWFSSVRTSRRSSSPTWIRSENPFGRRRMSIR